MAKDKEHQLEQEIESLQKKVLELDERRKSLQESENLLSIISRTTTSAIFIIQNEKICFINKAGESLFGYKAPEIYQVELGSLIIEEDLIILKSDKIVNPGETIANNSKIRIKNPLRGERTVEITSVSIFYKGKIAFVCTAYDITSYSEMNEVSAENQLLLNILDSLPIGVSLSDVNGTIIAENKIMHEIWQNGTTNVSTENVKVYNTETRELIKQDDWIVARALRDSEKILNEVIDVEIGSDRKTVNISAIPLYLVGDELKGIIVVCENITKQRSDEEQSLLLGKIIEFSDDAIIGKDLDGIITSWNKGAQKMYGYKAKEIIGKPVNQLIPVEFQGEIESVLEAILDNRNIEHYETKRIKKDGTLFDISVSFSPIKNRSGRIIGVSSIAHDTTMQKAAAEKLRESEERFRRIFKEGPIGIAIIGLDYRFNNANNRFCDMVGYSKQELTAKTFIDITYQEDIDIDIKQAEALSKGEIPFYNMDKRYIRKDGSVFWVNLNTSMIRDRNNSPLYYLTLIEDITARKEAELRIIESEERYRTLAKNFPNGMVFLFDHDLRYVVADGAALREQGLGSEMTEGNTIWDVYPYETASLVEPYYRKALNGESNTFEITNEGRIFEVRTLPIRNYSGEITGGMAMTLDITERKNNEEMLKELITGKDKFFSIIAHDLKNPFTSLLGFSEMLSNDIENLKESEVKDLSFTIYKSAKVIYNLLDNLLQWSKLQSGRIDFIPGCFSMNEIIEQTVSVFQPNAIKKKIHLQSQIDPQLYAYADKNMIDTVIRNLVSNAIKFTNIGGNVKIYAAHENDLIQVDVFDDGVGIKPEIIDKLFILEKQTTTLGTDKEKGTGLGLILCKEFIEKNGGKIWVESEPEVGTRFYFTIPANMKN